MTSITTLRGEVTTWPGDLTLVTWVWNFHNIWGKDVWIGAPPFLRSAKNMRGQSGKNFWEQLLNFWNYWGGSQWVNPIRRRLIRVTAKFCPTIFMVVFHWNLPRSRILVVAYAYLVTYANLAFLSPCIRKIGILDFLLTRSGILGLCLRTPRKGSSRSQLKETVHLPNMSFYLR